MNDPFREAFLAFLRKIDEDEDFAASLTIASVPKDSDADWWASWNVKIGGRTYALNLVSLHRMNQWCRTNRKLN